MKTKNQLTAQTTQTAAMLTQWHEHSMSLQAKFRDVNGLFGNHAEAPLEDAVFKMFDSYTEALSKLVGDDNGWLAWFMWENEGGALGMKAKPGTGKRERSIRTVSDLVRLLMDAKECETKRTGVCRECGRPALYPARYAARHR